MKHTPAPWIAGKFELVGDGDLRADCGVYHMDGGVAHSVCRCPAYQGQRQWESDARLIAAAPTMYDYIATRASDGDKRAAEIIEVINGNA